MKASLIRRFGIITLLQMAAFSLNSQGLGPKPRVGSIIHEDAPRTCLTVNLDPESKTLKKACQDYLQKNYSIKLKGIGLLSNKDLLSAKEVSIERISSSKIYLYTQIVEDVNGSEMKVFAALDQDNYIDKIKNPNQFNALDEIFQNFLKEYLPQYHQGRVFDAEKRVKELAREREKLKATIVQDANKIEKLKLEIEDRSLNLAANKAKLELAEEKLEKRKEKMERIRI